MSMQYKHITNAHKSTYVDCSNIAAVAATSETIVRRPSPPSNANTRRRSRPRTEHRPLERYMELELLTNGQGPGTYGRASSRHTHV